MPPPSRPQARFFKSTAFFGLYDYMFKPNASLLVLTFAILVTAGCNKAANSNTAVANNGNAPRSAETTNAGSGAHPLSSPVAQSTEQSTGTTQVRLTLVETNADLIDAPLADARVTLKSAETSSDKRTDEEGVVLFDSMPCGKEIVITARDVDSEEETTIKRRLECKGPQTDLGLLIKPFGGKFIVEERRPEHMEYDPAKNVWLSEGKVVPMEKVRKILSKYVSN